MKVFGGPEKTFQKHIAKFLAREHGFALLTQEDITDTEFYFAEDHLYAFLKATQSETLERLEVDYGSDARDNIFRALRKEVAADLRAIYTSAPRRPRQLNRA